MTSSPLIRTNSDVWNIVFTLIFLGVYGVLCFWFFLMNTSLRSVGGFDFFVLIFATYRISRLLTYDKITEFIRDFYTRSTSSFGKTMHALLVCHWCTSMWSALVVVILYSTVESVGLLLLVLAISGSASLIQNLTNVSTRYVEKTLLEQKFLEGEQEK